MKIAADDMLAKIKSTAFVFALWLFSLPILAGEGPAPLAKPPTLPQATTQKTPSTDFAIGSAAYDAGDYAKARRHLLPLAEQGNVKAQYALGRLYEKGRGVDRDFVEALKWYRKAAEKGHADSQYRLAVGYGYGLGVVKDEAVATEWLRKAAENGQKRAQKSLAKGYADGLFGLPRDPEKAKHWYERSNSRE